MTEANTPSVTPAASPANAKPPAEWKPEPRQWTWKDLFTAPMLAFKPKCMVVSALTLLALGVLAWGFQKIAPDISGNWIWPVYALFLAIALAVFGAGATLVAIFLKADLLDDEFLSLGEALGQYKSRLLPAMLVPIFLAVLVVGVHGLMVWFPLFIASIPYAGGFIYGLFYVLFFAAAVFAVLLFIVVAFSMFVFPAIVSIRRHGWFDNVVDTIEAVGTRPHILIASLLLTFLFIVITLGITDKAQSYLQHTAASAIVPKWGESKSEPTRVEQRSGEISRRATMWLDFNNVNQVLLADLTSNFLPMGQGYRNVYEIPQSQVPDDGRFHMGSGLIGGFWQTLIIACVFGYCLNLFISGGMLTYLLVREDDYWDDEDLEDLDKLAKELEAEAKREEQGAPAPAAEPPKA
ncbi:MAG: hypothetical protein AAB263_06545 [Planctomycetota bacterium]|mgnify:CR=1 FL=1